MTNNNQDKSYLGRGSWQRAPFWKQGLCEEDQLFKASQSREEKKKLEIVGSDILSSSAFILKPQHKILRWIQVMCDVID